ncbi:sugar MFS transporter [Tahibacter soli]|uniref:Sugar MFS transporter n=1 Tax=Tahibacter soli TaxID=2983605 RepID=A0A9X3YJG0_9GAMM|nr:sugar MFS transporter [Tahibacter soli]MDC8012677.1 sugar MFS transporter [Tahibacter soli]
MPQHHRSALVVVTVMFFLWGFITELNDVLIPHLKDVFTLTYWQAMLIQSCFFGAYLVMSIPAGRVIARVGYTHGIVLGLVVAGCGALAFLPAAAFHSYPLFLGALFVLATGIVLLQVSANPYVSLLGAPERAASRLSFAQAVNSLGHTLGPYVGGLLILGGTVLGADALARLSPDELAAYRQTQANSVQLPYVGLAVALFALAVVVKLFRLPPIVEATEQAADHRTGFAEVWRHRRLRYGVVAIFLYVGAEVTIGSFLGNYLARPDIGAVAPADVGGYISMYWGGAMIGRFVGAALLLSADPRRLVVIYAAIAMALLATTIAASGSIAMWSVLAVGLVNSILFPTIFTLAIEGLGPLTQRASSLLVTAIFGGAAIPFVQGAVVDALKASLGDETAALQYAFLIPLLCYAYVAWYAARGSRAQLDRS